MAKRTKEYKYKPREVTLLPAKRFRFGQGEISGYLSCALGVLSFLAVLCYQFPSYLTTTELRAAYDADMLQVVLKFVMYFSLGFGLLTFALGYKKRLGAIGILFTFTALAIGGYSVETVTVKPSKLAFGLDWLILDFLGSSILFIFLEKIFPKYKDQVILRPEWNLDLIYFCMNHLLITILLLIGNSFSENMFGWAIEPKVPSCQSTRQLLEVNNCNSPQA